jgi:hypothetical protein
VLPRFGFLADQPFFGLARDDRLQDVTFAAEAVPDRLTLDFHPIAYVQGGLLAVKVAGDDLDSIWYWDDDDPRDREGYDPAVICAQLLHRCADSIDAFWAALVPPPPSLVDLARDWAVRGYAVEVRDESAGAALPVRMRAPWQPTTNHGPDPLASLFEAR